MTTIAKRLYSGTGWPLSNGSGQAITLQTDVGDLAEATYDLLTEVRAVVGGPGSTLAQQIAAISASGIAAAVVEAIIDALFGGTPPSSAVTTLDDLVPLQDSLDQLASSTPIPLPSPTYNLGNIYEAIGAPLNVGTLPDPPPSGYGGGASAEDVAAAVFATPFSTITGTGHVLGDFGDWVVEVGNQIVGTAWTVGLRDPRNPYFALVASTPSMLVDAGFSGWSGTPYGAVPALDFSAVLPGDTVLSFLSREVDSYSWDNEGPWGSATPGGVYAPVPGGGGLTYWRCLLTDEELHLLAGQLGASATGAPVWPGIAGVTLGTPVAFDDLLQVDEPMDGVIVAYTTPPQKVSVYSFGLYTAYGRAGQITFVSDNGQAEEEQWLQFDQALYTPKSMARAASCIIRPLAGQEGTITPWTVT